MNDQNYFILHANCIPVKGATRSVICDLQQGEIHFIPNDLYDLLKQYSGVDIVEIKKKFNHKFDPVIDEYFDFLIQRKLGFWGYVHELELFPPMSMHWDEPSIINNAIIDFNKSSKHDFGSIVKQLEDLGCKHIQIRLFYSPSSGELSDLISCTEGSIIRSLEIICKYSGQVDYDSFFEASGRVSRMILYSSPEEKDDNRIIQTLQEITDHNHCGFVSPYYFSVNIQHFTESIAHNTCLNRKIGIDVEGHIKNCPSMQTSFGKFPGTSLLEAINEENFQKNWSLNKDQVDSCKVCEFRYICTDCRAFLNTDDSREKPKKCNYNPYKGIWEEPTFL